MSPVEPASSYRDFLAQPNDGSYYPGHATVIVRVAGKVYIVDPVLMRPLLRDSWVFYPENIVDPLHFEVDGVFISHFHEDHYDPNALKLMRPGTPIYVTKGRAVLEEQLRAGGFNVQPIEPMQPMEIAPGVTALAMPSEYNQIDSSFIIKGNGFSVYQGNDNFLTEATLSRARELMGRINHAYIPYAYIWWYPICLASISAEERHRELHRLMDKHLEIGISHGEILGADMIVPCGGNLVFHDNVDSEVNKAVYSPLQFKDYAERTHPDIAKKIFPLFAGDYAHNVDDRPKIVTAGLTSEQHRKGMAARLKEHAAQVGYVAPPPQKVGEKDLDFLKPRLAALAAADLSYDLLFQRDGDMSQGILVQLPEKKVSVSNRVTDTRPWIRFEVDPLVYDAWTDGTEKFEVMLETSRFRVHRQPEKHDPRIWEVLRLDL